jgi:hypothetical protein
LFFGALVAVILMGPVPAHAGVTLYGSVRGPSGVVEGVSVTPVSASSGVSGTTTDSYGNFRVYIDALPPGVSGCDFALSKSGFVTRTVSLGYGLNSRYFIMVPPNSVYGELWLGTYGSDYSGVVVSCDGQTSRTDSNGRFALTGLSPGTKAVVFSKPGYGTVTRTAELVTGGTLYMAPSLTLGLTVTGVVTDAFGLPLPGAVVSVGATSTTTDAYGAYSLVDIESNGSTETASKAGYAPRTRTKYLFVGNANTVDFTLLPPDSIGGAVRDSEGAPLSGVLVTCGDAEAVSNASGRYLLTSVLPGAVTLRFSRYGYLGYSASTTLVTGSFADIDAQLSLLGSVYGYVCGPTGLRIVGARVTAGTRTVITDAGGNYDLGPLPVGPTPISFEATGFVSVTCAVTVQLGTATREFVYLDSTPGAVDGVVSAWQGSAVSNVTVQLDGVDSVVTDRSGHYRMSGVSRGTQKLTFTKSGYDSKSAYVDVAGSGSVSTLKVTLVSLGAATRLSIHSDGVRTTYARSCELTGFLKNGRGQALAGRTVLLQEYSGGGWKSVKRLTTSSTGRVHASVHPKTDRDYRFRFSGDSKHVSGSSGLQQVRSCYSKVTGYADAYNMWANDSVYLTKGKHKMTAYASQGAKDAAIANTSLSWTKVVVRPLPASKTRTVYVDIPRTGNYYFGWHGSRYTNNYFRFTIW